MSNVSNSFAVFCLTCLFRCLHLQDQSNSSIYKGSEVRKMVKLSTDLKPYGYAESDDDEDDGDDNGGGGAIEEQP